MLLYFRYLIFVCVDGTGLMVGNRSVRPEITQLAGLTGLQRQIESCDLFPDVGQRAERILSALYILDVVTDLFDFRIKTNRFLVQFFDLGRIMDPETDHDKRKDDRRQDQCHDDCRPGFLPRCMHFVRRKRWFHFSCKFIHKLFLLVLFRYVILSYFIQLLIRFADLSFAQADLLFTASSSADAVTGFFVRISSFGCQLQMQTGYPGGHLQETAIS